MPIEATILRATRYNQYHYGLITVQVTVPLYIWTEILTHRSFSRNASSARAMGTRRYTDMGYYTPETFYFQGSGMTSSDAPLHNQWLARAIWHTTTKITHLGAYLLDRLGVAKEQKNRLVAPNKYVRGIVTGTEDAWKEFLVLRNNQYADRAMQDFAQLVQTKIGHVVWVASNYHKPFEGSIIDGVASAARVSYNRTSGKNNYDLVKSLFEQRHMSPFEHFAKLGVWNGISSNFSDTDWFQLRKMAEQERDFDRFIARATKDYPKDN